VGGRPPAGAGGQTPREAVRTALGREGLEVLLAQLEDHAGHGAMPDMIALHRRLGL
jgi:hypothetical protein